MEVVDSSSDLSNVLRKCRILAQRLNHEGFKQWVAHELEGYPPGSELPDYRVCRHNMVLGHFVGPFGSGIKGAQIPHSAIPDEFRDMLTEVRFFDGVAYLTESIRTTTKGHVQSKWPAEACGLIGQGTIFAHMNLVEAYQVVTTATVAGILDNIRNRILNFVLELETRNPDAGEPVKNKNEIPREQVQHIFNTTINGGVGNLAQGSSDFSQQANVQVNKGDIDSLVRELCEIGIAGRDIQELRSAVSEEPAAPKGKFGNKVTAWIGKAICKAGEGAYKVSTSVAADVITQALKKYYGI
jgi:hypothetical protein